MIVNLYIGTDKIDMFKDENVSIKDSTINISDISKNTTAYSKSFTVPATENNNRIFKHYYNASLDNGFDARTKQDAKITLDGLTFKRGELRLNEVIIKSGLPSSYNIQFWGKLIDLKKKVGNDKLKDLDFTAFNHTYDSATVKTGLQSSLFSGAITYNLLPKKRYYYNSDAGDNTNTEQITNIAFNGGDNSVKPTDLSPSIKVNEVIKAIESKYSINFSIDFFERSEFQDLYLLVNDKKDNNKSFTQEVDFDGGDDTWVNLTTNTGTFTKTFTDINNNVYFNHSRTITPTNLSQPYILNVYLNDALISSNSRIGIDTVSFNSFSYFDYSEETTYTLRYEIVSDSALTYTVSWSNTEVSTVAGSTSSDTKVTTASSNTIPAVLNVALNMPDIKVIDFLKGLFNAFKLIVITEDDGSIYVNDINSYYDSGDLINVSNYIDYKEFKVSRGELYNEVIYNFKEPQTILNKQFEENTGIPYGDEEAFLYDDNGQPLDGSSQKIELPFEQVIYERLTDVVDNSETNIMYGALIDSELKQVNVKPHIFYNINQEVGSKKIGYLNDNGTVTDDVVNINTASHTNTFTNHLYSFLFSEEFNEWNGEITSNNLYTNYHKRFIDNTFNVKRRNFNYSAVLPLDVILKLSLNDVLKIKENYYRILDYDLNLITRETKFKLMNAFDVNLRKLTPNNLFFYINNVAQSVTTYVVNGSDKVFTFSFQDLGFGTSWVTPTQSGANIINSVDANTTGATREIFVIVSLDAVEQFRIYINQIAKTITADNNVLTADNNIITADNG